MADKHTLNITLHLQEIDHLFTHPNISPFSEDYQLYSFKTGLDYIIGEWYNDPRTKQVNLTIFLPPEKVTPGLEGQTLQAIHRYARAWSHHARQEKIVSRYYGTRAVTVGVFAFILFTAVGLWLDRFENFWISVLSQGLSVCGWVLLWWPLDTLFFQMWLHRSEETGYGSLPVIQVTILSEG